MVAEIDNNGKMLTLKKDINTEDEDDEIPIPAILYYKQVAGADGLKNQMKID
jgi:hypothetical protein